MERKLPLLIGGLLLIAIVALTVAAWREVRGLAQRSANDRLGNAAGELSDLIRQQLAQIRQRIAPLAADPALAEFARNPDARTRAAALVAMSTQPDVVTTELRDASGRVLLATRSEPNLAALALREAIPSTERGDSAAVGNFVMLRDTMVYPVAAPLAGAPDHYVVRWRRMAGSRQQRERFGQLVGSEAAIYLGNARGDLWHNLEQPVARPMFADSAVAGADVASGYARRGEAHLAMVRAIPGAPWVVAVDFPAEPFFGPVNAFLQRMLGIAALALILALIAAWLVSRRVTRPLRDLTHAAEEMSAGHYGLQVTLDSSDELGRLARSFSAMSTEVQRSRGNLEALVDQRTRELREAQESLVRRERLAMLGQLSSGVGHELRNPLGVMTNSVYYLKTVLHDAKPKVHEYLDIISQQVALSEKIVSDLLDFARQKPPQRKPAPLAMIVEGQVDRLGKRDGVRLAIEIPSDLPDVLVDPVQVGQVVFNLLSNAVQALESGGEVKVRARRADGTVTLTVADTGPGIAPENIEKIFEPLFTTKARGIGLGLAVSRTLAQANGGELTVASEPGRGAAFTLSLEAVSNGMPARRGGRTVSGGVA